MALASKTEKPSLLTKLGVLIISVVLSLTSTESPAKAAMALICLWREGIKMHITELLTNDMEERTRFFSISEVVYKVPTDMSTLR